MEDYAIGHGDHLKFCYRIERELMRMGDIRGQAGSQKFGVWYSKKDGKYQNTEKFGSSLEEAWAAVKAEIINLVTANTLVVGRRYLNTSKKADIMERAAF